MQQQNIRYLIVFAVIALTITFFTLLFLRPGGEKLEPADLEIWGVFDESVVWSDILSEYQRDNPHVKLTYKMIQGEDYERTLVNELAEGRGPDIFYIHNTGLPKFQGKIVAQPESVSEDRESAEQKSTLRSFRDYQSEFVDVVSEDFVRAEKIYAVPLYVDTLALYYNKDLFNAAGIAHPPETWDEFVEAVEKLTRVNAFGTIEQAGAAFGTAKNVNRSPDILSLLMMQLGSPMVDTQMKRAVFAQTFFGTGEGGTKSPGADALTFYTNFADPTKSFYTWNPDMSYSIDAFYEGKAAMMVNYSHHIETIKRKAPYLRYGIAAVPQPAETLQQPLTFANYWGLAVSRLAEKPAAAWEFLNAVTNRDRERVYLEKTKRPPARRDLIDEMRGDPLRGVFAEQSLVAASWLQPDNNEVDRIFADTIEDVVAGRRTVSDAIRWAEDQVNLLFKR